MEDELSSIAATTEQLDELGQHFECVWFYLKAKCIIIENVVALLHVHFSSPVFVIARILFPKLSWPGGREGTFRSSSQAATCLPRTVEVLSCPLLLQNVKQGALNTNFCSLLFDPTGNQTGVSTVSVADILSTLHWLVVDFC